MRMLVVLCIGVMVAFSSTCSSAQEDSKSVRGKAKSRLQLLVSNGRQHGRKSNVGKVVRDNQGKTKTTSDNVAGKKLQNNARNSQRDNRADPLFQPKPDLVALYVIDEGNHAVIAIQNQGQFRSNATNVRLHISSLGKGPSSTHFADLPELAPKETKMIRIRGLSLIYVSMIAQVDFPNLVAESNEKNNMAKHVVNEKREELADLAITKMQFFPNEKEVWVTVHNYGRKTVARAPLHLTGNFGLKASPKLRHTVENLKPGLFQTFRFFPKEINRGTQFEALVDSNNRVPEANENNNRLVRTF